MAFQITELTFMEQLAGRFNLPTPEYLVATASRAEIRDALARWGGKGIVKADIMRGGKSKAGAVKIVSEAQEALREMRTIVEAEAMPEPTTRATRCVNCEFRRFCNDVL